MHLCIIELDCPARNCAEDMFECANHQCIEYGYVCDGKPASFFMYHFDCNNIAVMLLMNAGSKDCEDGSDELRDCFNSGLKVPRCGDGEFECGNGACIPKTQVCDTYDNCNDASDENMTLCATSTVFCAAPTFFRCGMYLIIHSYCIAYVDLLL